MKTRHRRWSSKVDWAFWRLEAELRKSVGLSTGGCAPISPLHGKEQQSGAALLTIETICSATAPDLWHSGLDMSSTMVECDKCTTNKFFCYLRWRSKWKWGGGWVGAEGLSTGCAFFQRTLVCFPVATWQLTTICNCILWHDMPSFDFPGYCTNMVHMQTGRQNLIHIELQFKYSTKVIYCSKFSKHCIICVCFLPWLLDQNTCQMSNTEELYQLKTKHFKMLCFWQSFKILLFLGNQWSMKLNRITQHQHPLWVRILPSN